MMMTEPRRVVWLSLTSRIPDSIQLMDPSEQRTRTHQRLVTNLIRIHVLKTQPGVSFDRLDQAPAPVALVLERLLVLRRHKARREVRRGAFSPAQRRSSRGSDVIEVSQPPHQSVRTREHLVHQLQGVDSKLRIAARRGRNGTASATPPPIALPRLLELVQKMN